VVVSTGLVEATEEAVARALGTYVSRWDIAKSERDTIA